MTSSFDGGVPGDASSIVSDAGELPEAGYTIEIRPADPVLQATGAPLTQTMEAYVKGGLTRVAARWTIDSLAMGSIDPLTGVFTANGVVGGSTVVRAAVGKESAVTTLTVNVALSDNAGSVSAGDRAKLQAGGALANDPAFRWLYPYDATVFPRGLKAPVLQLGGAGIDALLVRVTSKHMTYEGFFGPSDPPRVTLDQARWRRITESAGANDTVSVSVTKLKNGVATGPVRETWIVAPGTLKGTVYYNTYATAQAGGTGALMKVRPGSATDAQVFVSTCTVCHSVSANGSHVVAGAGWAGGNPQESGTFEINRSGGAVSKYKEGLGRFSFGALTPDGAYVMTSAVAPGGIRGLSGSTGAALHATASGQQVSAPGWDRTQAQMPSFSPDGRFIVFNDRALSAGRTLGMMSFQQATRTFSSGLELLTEASKLVAWPAFLPDAKSVVFHAGTDFGTENATADIEIVDVASKRRAKMPRINGWLGDDRDFTTTYLPYGETSEAHLNYEPTVLPVAVGGYFWVVFTSRRAYGTEIDHRVDKFAELSRRKKLWVAAIDLEAKPGVDRSHPAFYLPGQDVATGNMRGFWALDPCLDAGKTCDSGDECCSGFCRENVCVTTPAGCAFELEKCTSDGDCCGSSLGYRCLNGRCAQPPPR